MAAAGLVQGFKNLVEGDNVGTVVTTDAGGRNRWGERIHVQYSPFPASAEFGGPDFRINSATELAALRARMAQLSVDVGDALWRTVRSSDMSWIVTDEGGPDDLQQACREVFEGDYDGYAYMCRDGERIDFTDPDSDPIATIAIADYDIEDKPALEDYCYDHGWLRKARCYNYMKDGNHAIKKARALYSGTWKLSDQTVSNAFQHAYWTALMTNRGYPGYHVEALEVSHLWETDKNRAWKYYSSQPAIRRPSQMDIINDQTGYYVALDEIAARGVRSRSELCLTFARDGGPQQYPAHEDPFDVWDERNLDYDQGWLWYRRSKDKNGTLVERVNLNC